MSTEHFTVYSDLRPAFTEEHARKLEWMLHGLLETGWEYHGKLPFKLNVVLLSDPSDLEQLVSSEYGGYFKHDVLAEPWAILAAPRSRVDLSGLLYELSHHLSYLVLPYQPVWFSAGLASYYGTAKLSPEGDFVLGSAHRDHHRFLSRNGIMPSAKLFTFQGPPNSRVYANSWLAVHYLMSRHADEFVRYQDELARGQTHEGAWRNAFPGLKEEQLDDELQDYFSLGEYAVLQAPLEWPAVTLTSKPLSAADEEALWATLWLSCSHCTKEERVERALRRAQRALSLEPMQHEARLIRAAFDERVNTMSELRALTRHVPNDYRVWLALAMESSGDEAHQALQRALSLAPQRATCWAVAAQQAMQRGELDSALASAERALRIQPTSLDLLLLNAEILAQLRRCPELLRVARRVYDFDERRSSEGQRTRARELVAACGAPR